MASNSGVQVASDDATSFTTQCTFGAAMETTEATLEPKNGRLLACVTAHEFLTQFLQTLLDPSPFGVDAQLGLVT